MKILRQFIDKEEGSMSIELVLVTPVLVWALLSTFVYFDAYRAKSNNHRAALTVADMFSREQAPIDNLFLNGTRDLLEELTFASSAPTVRATVYRFEDPDSDGTGDYRVVWSQNRGMGANLTNTDLLSMQLSDRLPLLAHDDRAFLIETSTEYRKPFSIGIGPFQDSEMDQLTLRAFLVTRPRFVDEPCFDPSLSTPSDEIC